MDRDLDIVTELPQAGDIPLSQLLTLDRAVLTNALKRVQAFTEQPHDAVSAFQNFVSVRPG